MLATAVTLVVSHHRVVVRFWFSHLFVVVFDVDL
jgi:hypothetical protein